MTFKGAETLKGLPVSAGRKAKAAALEWVPPGFVPDGS